jgi:nucleoside-diphosphate-sugar epimerase
MDGADMAALEAFVHSYGLGQGWPLCALRPTGIYGLAHSSRACRWFDLVGQIVRGEPIESESGGKEVHAADVARAVGRLLRVKPRRVAGQSFQYIAAEQVARIARELTGAEARWPVATSDPSTRSMRAAQRSDVRGRSDRNSG